MFLFGKKNKKKAEDEQPAVPTGQIHTMPQQFFSVEEKHKAKQAAAKSQTAKETRPTTPAQQKSLPGTTKRLQRRVIVIGTVIVIVAVVAIASVLLLSSSLRQTVIIEKEVEVPVVVPMPVNEPIETEEPSVADQLPTDEDQLIDGEFIPPLFDGQIVAASDSDFDQLTDEEEKLYNTDPSKPDSDADGYLDGHEVLNLYNPAGKAPVRLERSGLVLRYTNPTYNYSVLYPGSWLPRSLDDSNQEVIFTSLTGEFLQVIIQGNPLELTAKEWYQRLIPEEDRQDIEEVTTKQFLEGVKSKDNLTYYLVDPAQPDVLLIVSYSVGAEREMHFVRTFEMFVNSLELGLVTSLPPLIIESETPSATPEIEAELQLLESNGVEALPTNEQTEIEELNDNLNETGEEDGNLTLPEDTPPPLPPVIRSINMTAANFSFQPNIIEAVTGETINLIIDSTGQHTFTVDELGIDMQLSDGLNSVDIRTGNQIGSYNYYCSIPGHREQGMEGLLIVR